jgi:hypothetical protein
MNVAFFSVAAMNGEWLRAIGHVTIGVVYTALALKEERGR